MPSNINPTSNVNSLPTPPNEKFSECQDSVPEELQLLDDHPAKETGTSKDHEFKTAPLFTREAYLMAEKGGHVSQYGVLGRVMAISSKSGSGCISQVPQDPRLYVNTNAPFSAVICGVQGSGKSHTVSVLLESMFIPRYRPVGSLPKPLCGLVLHFGEGGSSARPCEAAWVGVPSHTGFTAPKVNVYVSPSSLKTMRGVYKGLGNRVTVEPLLFSEEELDAEAFLTMMAVDSSESTPLYVQIILSILRELGENYTYQKFKDQLDVHKKKFNPAQLRGLQQRMSLLTSFMDIRKVNGKAKKMDRFTAGQLTIIDLSDPFVNSESASGFFEIVTRLFVRANVGTGKVLLVDEAHKYLSLKEDPSGLTKQLITLTREQRHLAMRVLISTQEPTVVPSVLLDLCTVAILHRFSSPAWWKHISQHISADVDTQEAFDAVVRLQTGEGVVIAPAGLCEFQERDRSRVTRTPDLFGRRWVTMKTRRRVTKDGGASVLVLGVK